MFSYFIFVLDNAEPVIYAATIPVLAIKNVDSIGDTDSILSKEIMGSNNNATATIETAIEIKAIIR
tara:strand:+ start:336 stop:533 length:198 start_codon:yes stop_codon:yes gene_type:complete